MAAPALARPLLADPATSDEGWVESALTRIGAALDRAMLAGMRLAFADALQPDARAVATLEETARPYLDEALQREPRRFFAFLDAPMPTPAARTLDQQPIRDGTIVVRELEAEYTPWHASDSWPACAENQRIPLAHWMHRPGRARAVVVALHGFTMGRPWIDARVLMAARWFARGYDVVMPVLPFHGTRAPCGSRYSGEAFGSWDVGRLNEAVRQAVYDVTLVRRWLLARARAPVGLIGLSLGGYVTSLLAGLCRDLAFAVPVAAPASLDGCRSGSSASGRSRRRRPRSRPRSWTPPIASTRRSHSGARSRSSGSFSSEASATVSCPPIRCARSGATGTSPRCTGSTAVTRRRSAGRTSLRASTRTSAPSCDEMPRRPRHPARASHRTSQTSRPTPTQDAVLGRLPSRAGTA